MTRKDYELIAEAINGSRCLAYGPDEVDVVDAVAQRMAMLLGEENPAFDKARFLTACGVA